MDNKVTVSVVKLWLYDIGRRQSKSLIVSSISTRYTLSSVVIIEVCEFRSCFFFAIPLGWIDELTIPTWFLLTTFPFHFLRLASVRALRELKKNNPSPPPPTHDQPTHSFLFFSAAFYLSLFLPLSLSLSFPRRFTGGAFSGNRAVQCDSRGERERQRVCVRVRVRVRVRRLSSRRIFFFCWPGQCWCWLCCFVIEDSVLEDSFFLPNLASSAASALPRTASYPGEWRHCWHLTRIVSNDSVAANPRSHAMSWIIFALVIASSAVAQVRSSIGNFDGNKDAYWMADHVQWVPAAHCTKNVHCWSHCFSFR